MKLSLGAPRVALVVAPHPDDEVIGTFGLIARLRLAGVRVRVLVVTDGAASHANSRRWPRERLTRQRRRESRWALAQLGIRAADIGFLGLPDGHLAQIEPAATRALVRSVARVRDLDLVVGPLPDDDHSDHRIVARALARASARIRRLGYPVWPRPDAAKTRTLLVPGGALAKRRALGFYRSQTGLIADDPQGFALTPAQVAMFSRPVERFVELAR